MAPPVTGITEKDLTSLEGRVFLVTGGYSGCGYELCKILYHLNGKVYIAGRSESKAKEAIANIEASSPPPEQKVVTGKGSLHFLSLDLSDLSTIKGTAARLLSLEERLDVVWHNAGVMVSPDGSLTAQGHELQLGTNALGPFLLQSFLTPLLLKTASLPGVEKRQTRVVWLTSNAHAGGPKPDGVSWDDVELLGGSGFAARLRRYSQSKAMNNMYAHEFARLYEGAGLASLSCDPGRCSTGLQKDLPFVVDAVFRWWRYPPRMGALSELFAGFCEVGEAENGGFVAPYGQFGQAAEHITEGLKQRGTGERLWKLSEDMVKEFM